MGCLPPGLSGHPEWRATIQMPVCTGWLSTAQMPLQEMEGYSAEEKGQSVARRGNPPKPARVQIALDKEKWHTNKPTVNAILQAWIAPQPSIQDNESLTSSTAEQKWKGLALQDFGEWKGKGVIALMPFCKGDVVCNYHGTYISEAEEKRRPQLGYLFFFRGKCDRGMCINATAFPCACLPDIETYGMRMNHSRKNPNIKPQKFTMNFPTGP
ncbi:uncharacterized protein LOC120719233 [Simochromis diagramma]|uniref:uncharacterized protein LOC120719233 n=1 Tax=Simochromis diagramma TaxID=43689 RepID=UPI001A7E53F1|nr:uncharacterized protein LOC120719233 [Simochromis diagramma]